MVSMILSSRDFSKIRIFSLSVVTPPSVKSISSLVKNSSMFILPCWKYSSFSRDSCEKFLFWKRSLSRFLKSFQVPQTGGLLEVASSTYF